MSVLMSDEVEESGGLLHEGASLAEIRSRFPLWTPERAKLRFPEEDEDQWNDADGDWAVSLR